MESIELSLITLGEFLHSSLNDWNDYQHAKQEALEAYYVISDHIKSPQPTMNAKSHVWNKSGERCVVCGDKDWMGTVCDGGVSSPQPTMPQQETNCPRIDGSKLSGHDQVTRDEFDQEAM